MSRLTRFEFSPRNEAGDLDFWGGALGLISVSDVLRPLMLKASEAPSVEWEKVSNRGLSRQIYENEIINRNGIER